MKGKEVREGEEGKGRGQIRPSTRNSWIRHCTSAGMSTDIKKPFDEYKMHIIKTTVFNLYPQQNDAVRKAVWIKCVDKVNTDVSYLFKVKACFHARVSVRRSPSPSKCNAR